MINDNIIIDRAVLGFNGGGLVTSVAQFQGKLNKDFGATLAHRFDDVYKYVTFSFRGVRYGKKFTRHGFNDINEFLTFINNSYSNDGSTYNDDIEIIVYLDVDTKMTAPTLYAKNSRMGQLKNKGSYRKDIIIEQSVGVSNYSDSLVPEVMRNLWYEVFSEDLTISWIQNQPKFKYCFWLQKDPDRAGVPPANFIIDPSFSARTQRKMYNSTDSVIGSSLVINEKSDVQNDGQQLVLSNVTPPRYFVLKASLDGSWDKIWSGDWGARIPNMADAINSGYTVLNVHGIENVVGGKTLRALFISAVGVDTVYWDFIDPNKYRVFSIKKSPQGNLRMKMIPFPKTGNGNRLGRVDTSEWFDADTNDNTSTSFTKSQGDTYFVYQDIRTNKFSPLSQSKMKMVRSNSRFRIPYFVLEA